MPGAGARRVAKGARTRKRTWETPRLTVHGTVADVTAGSGGAFPDIGGGNSALIIG